MSAPRDYDTEKRVGARDANRWGELPEQARDAFTNDSTQDLPIRYRRWIEAFYRRVAKSGSTH